MYTGLSSPSPSFNPLVLELQACASMPGSLVPSKGLLLSLLDLHLSYLQPLVPGPNSFTRMCELYLGISLP